MPTRFGIEGCLVYRSTLVLMLVIIPCFYTLAHDLVKDKTLSRKLATLHPKAKLR